jgi:hypothetical protein
LPISFGRHGDASAMDCAVPRRVARVSGEFQFGTASIALFHFRARAELKNDYLIVSVMLTSRDAYCEVDRTGFRIADGAMFSSFATSETGRCALESFDDISIDRA